MKVLFVIDMGVRPHLMPPNCFYCTLHKERKRAVLFFFSPFLSVTLCLVGICITSHFSRYTRVTHHKLYTAFVKAARGGVSLVAAASCVGIILGIVTLTGVGSKLPGAIIPLAQNHVILALILLMVSTIILGMGLPSAVCYLLMATLIGSVLAELQTAPLAAHLFIFYFGMMSMVTPPVALAAYTAAAIADSDVMKSGFTAFRFALVGFALPFAFVLRPELLMLTPTGALAGPVPIVLNVGITVVAIIGLAAGIAGFIGRTVAMGLRVVLIALAFVIFLMRPDAATMWAQIVALAGIVVIVGYHWGRRVSADGPAG
ncbi:MAG: TRAP transporter large permease subunit [Verrucomicrobiota bacterium]